MLLDVLCSTIKDRFEDEFVYICLQGPLRRLNVTLKRICTVLTHYDDQKSVTLMFWAVLPLLLSVYAYC